MHPCSEWFAVEHHFLAMDGAGCLGLERALDLSHALAGADRGGCGERPMGAVAFSGWFGTGAVADHASNRRGVESVHDSRRCDASAGLECGGVLEPVC